MDSNNNILLSQKSLDYLWEKQRIISENIANNETPGYKAKTISFEDELNANLDKFSNRKDTTKEDVRDAILDSKIRVDVSKEESNRLDGNNVNLDVEEVELNRAQLQYMYQVYQINDQFTRIRTAIGK
ncbi:flagellar basal body rod protein FlgB [Aminipila luticellarii]|uniref:Flagellar basal body rod protein FlgB n=1 Tax=Aminipila luticellarii TaxID=2507160 RepID=A0A410PYM5_9FIRM|nr:flagellar basal body rod protein FlgB [Aminipila luticellarii]